MEMILQVKCDVAADNQICFADACDAIISALTEAKEKSLNDAAYIPGYGTLESADGELLGEWTLDQKRRRR